MTWMLANYLAPQDGPCVRWPFAPLADGYGGINVDGKMRRAHNYALTLRDGPGPPGTEAAHGPCNDPLCIIHVSWKTRAENAADMQRDGTTLRGKPGVSRRKLTEGDVRQIRRLRAAGESSAALAIRFQVVPGTIRGIITGRRWSWLD